MQNPRYQKPRTKFDLVRRAALLGCSPSHLARVIAGKRQSASLLVRLERLMEAEAAGAAKTDQTSKPNS